MAKASRVDIQITVNGRRYQREVEPRTLLVHFLRDTLGLTGTNIGCETSLCGACSVLLDGKVVKSCSRLAVQADSGEVTTIEGLTTGDELHPIQQELWSRHGVQCGYCTPGVVMAATALLQRNPQPTEEDIRNHLKGNLCRCTGYYNIVQSVQAAAAAGAVAVPGAGEAR